MPMIDYYAQGWDWWWFVCVLLRLWWKYCREVEGEAGLALHQRGRKGARAASDGNSEHKRALETLKKSLHCSPSLRSIWWMCLKWQPMKWRDTTSQYPTWSLSTIYNITNDGESNLQSDLHSPVKMTQLCLVFTSLGAWVLILSEFVTFKNNLKPNK